MHVTNANVEPIILVPKESMRKATEGSYLEFVCEFEIAAGSRLEPHKHNTHEYYYVLSGHATMQIAREKREVKPGDLIHIPPNTVHSIAPLGNKPVRSLAFAASFLPPGGAGLDAEPAELPA